MRKVLLAVLLLMCAGVARAQTGFTFASGYVLDPNGNPYSRCSGSAAFAPSPSATTVPTINGSVFQTDVPISSCDSFGFLTITLADNNVVSDGHTSPPASQWNFAITSEDGKTSFQCKFTITGTTQTITNQLQACAPILPAGGGGGGAFVVKSVPCAPSMNFPIGGYSPNTANTAFSVALNCNVSSSQILGNLQVTTGAQVEFAITNAGGYTFNWPSNFLNPPSVQTTGETDAYFWFDGTNWHRDNFPSGGGGTSLTIQNNTTPLPSKPNLNFISPVLVTPNSGNNSNDVSVPTMGPAGTNHASGLACDPGSVVHGTPYYFGEDCNFHPLPTNTSVVNPLTPSSLSNGSSPFQIGTSATALDMAFTGPNPWVDVRGWGVRAVAHTYTNGLTGNISSGSSTLSISASSGLKNGDGITVFNAGIPNTIGTPPVPTVVPVVPVDLTGTGHVVNAPAGSNRILIA